MNTNLPSWPESRVRVRFKDCDPLGHLYNTRYLEYMLEAREDQIFNLYDLDLSQYAETRGFSWVIVKHEIAYLKEAKRNEFVIIKSAIIQCHEKTLFVEYQMWNDDRTQLKAILWTHFLHISFLHKKAIAHPEDMMQLMQSVNQNITGISFDDRVIQLKSGK